MIPLNTFVIPQFDSMFCGNRLKSCIVCSIAQTFLCVFIFRSILFPQFECLSQMASTLALGGA